MRERLPTPNAGRVPPSPAGAASSPREPTLRPGRLVPPALLAISILAAAPFLGQLRDLALARAPADALALAALGFGAVAATALLVAVLRIRRWRALRYAGLGLCAVLVWLQLAGFATGIPEVDAVERAHLVAYGLLALLLYLAFRPLGLRAALPAAALSGLLVGIVDEWLQWLVASRVGEAGDIALNASATVTGLLFAVVVAPPESAPPRTAPPQAASTEARRPAAGSRAAVTALAAVVVVVFGAFYHCAHLGYWIHDPESRLAFRSWFAPDELPAVAEERRRRWRAGRLPTLDPLRREDYYFLEGTAHVAHRNASLERGDAVSAWAEQRILERHYAPVLEQRGLHSGEPLDLAPAHRETLRRRAESGERRGYASPVLAGRIATRPSKAAWWTGITVLAAALGGLAVRGTRAAVRAGSLERARR